jgi:hypothetical protein
MVMGAGDWLQYEGLASWQVPPAWHTPSLGEYGVLMAGSKG